jgi:hypothetical protein
MRARAFACRDAFADALRGLGVVEELRDFQSERTIQAREIPAPVLPDETDHLVGSMEGHAGVLNTPLPRASADSEPVDHSENQASPGKETSSEQRNEKGEFEF